MQVKRFATILMTFMVLSGVGVLVARWGDTAGRMDAVAAAQLEVATFAGGCFWGLQAAFNELPGVVQTRVGYTGGTVAAPTYGRVIAGGTGHAEAVEVRFDPGRVTYAEVVRHFFAHHRVPVGAPVEGYSGRHYRSAVFVRDETEESTVALIIAALSASGQYAGPVATRIEPAGEFWEAEAEHQNYLARCTH